MAKRNVIGMIFQLETSKGIAYGICTHEHVKYGTLVYLYPIGTQLSELKNATTQFCCFFPLSVALKRKVVEKVGKIEIPSSLKSFPVFRSGFPDQVTRRVKDWWFWDGEKEWMVGKINDSQRKMPIRGIINFTMLIERLEDGYTAETDLR